MSYDNLTELCDKIVREFPNITAKYEIGRSYQGNTIYAIEMTNEASENQAKKGVLVNGGHHARELTSYTMVMYLMLKTAYGYYNNHTFALNMLNSTVLYFVPVVNVDGFKYISQVFENTGQLKYIRKNRNDGRVDGYSPCLEDEYLGVDLNRNYDFKFGEDNVGSNPNPCAEDYRGPYPFSEPETRAVRDFLQTH